MSFPLNNAVAPLSLQMINYTLSDVLIGSSLPLENGLKLEDGVVDFLPALQILGMYELANLIRERPELKKIIAAALEFAIRDSCSKDFEIQSSRGLSEERGDQLDQLLNAEYLANSRHD